MLDPEDMIEKVHFPFSLRKIELENRNISFIYSSFINLRIQKYFKIYLLILLCKNVSYYECFQFASVSQGVVPVLKEKKTNTCLSVEFFCSSFSIFIFF